MGEFEARGGQFGRCLGHGGGDGRDRSRLDDQRQRRSGARGAIRGDVVPQSDQDRLVLADSRAADGGERETLDPVGVEQRHREMEMGKRGQRVHAREAAAQRLRRTGPLPDGAGPAAHRPQQETAAVAEQGDRAIDEVIDGLAFPIRGARSVA